MKTRQCTSAKSQAAIRQCGFQQLNHPPYSPGQLPRIIFYSELWKNFYGVNDFQAMKKSRRKTRPGLKSSQKFFSRGIKSLQQKWAKCIELLGDYIEK